MPTLKIDRKEPLVVEFGDTVLEFKHVEDLSGADVVELQRLNAYKEEVEASGEEPSPTVVERIIDTVLGAAFVGDVMPEIGFMNKVKIAQFYNEQVADDSKNDVE